MIFSRILAKEDLLRCPKAIQKAVLYVAQTDFDALEDACGGNRRSHDVGHRNYEH